MADTKDHRKVSAMVKNSNESTTESDDEPDLREGFFLVPVTTLTDVFECNKP